MERLTYKSFMGDYGSTKDYNSYHEEIQKLRNALGKYEDLEEQAIDNNTTLKQLVDSINREV